MRDDTEQTAPRIEGIAEDAPLPLTYTVASDETDLEDIGEALSTSMAGEAARMMLMEAGTTLQGAANAILPSNSDWLAEAPNRMVAGEGDTPRDDLVYQTPDWERATGKKDNAISDLIG